MGRRGKSQDCRHVPHIVARVLGQLGGRNEPDEVDYPLEVGAVVAGEIPAQVFPRDSHHRRQSGRRHRPAGVLHDCPPRFALSFAGETERVRRVGQCPGEAHRVALRSYEVPRAGFVDLLAQNVCEAECRRTRDGFSIGGTKREQTEEWRAWKIRRVCSEYPVCIALRSEIDDYRIDELTSYRGFEFFDVAYEYRVAASPWKGCARERACALAAGVDKNAWKGRRR